MTKGQKFMEISPLPSAGPGSSLSKHFREFTIPALHLWWRFFWRSLLLPIVIATIIVLVAIISGSVAPQHRDVSMLGVVVGLGLLWLLLIPVIIAYGVWLMRRSVFAKPFLHHDQPCIFVVTDGHTPLPLPLSIETALGIWWGVVWRTWLGMVVTTMLLLFLGPIHVFLQIAVSYFAFLWLMSAPYGNLRITVAPLDTM